MKTLKLEVDPSVVVAKEGEECWITALVMDECTPVVGEKVTFVVTAGGGTLRHPHPQVKNPGGVATSDITNLHGEAYCIFKSDGNVGLSSIAVLATPEEKD